MKGLKFMECLDSREKLSTIYNLYCCLDNLCDNAHINKVDINGNVYLKEEFDT